MNRATILVAALFLSAGALAAQTPEAPKPGPEHQKLAAFVGNWTFDGELKPGPLGAGGKATGTDRIQWLPGNFFVERRFAFKSPLGDTQGVEVVGYDTARKTYTYNAFDNMGGLGSGTLTVKGNTWNASGTLNIAGQTIHERCQITFGTNATTLAMTCEMSLDGKTFAPSFEGKGTKGK